MVDFSPLVFSSDERVKRAICFNIKQIIVLKLILSSLIIISIFCLQESGENSSLVSSKSLKSLFKLSASMSTGGNVTPAPDKVPSSNPTPRGKKQYKFSSIKAKPVDGIPELADCVFHCEGRTAADYQDNVDKLARFVGSTMDLGGDLRQSILTLATVLPPRPAAPSDWDTAGPVEKKIWEIQITEHIKRVNKLASQLKKVYAIVWGQCTDYMRAKLKSDANFTVINDDQDVLSLLATIKSLTYKFDAKQYPPEALKNAILKLYKFFQGREMTNTQFFERFKNLVAVVEQHGGTIGDEPGLINAELAIITGAPYNEGTAYTAAQRMQAKEQAKEKFLAVLFLGAADRSRYGELTTGLHNDFVKGHETYPATLTGAFSLLMETKLPSKSGVDQGSSFVQGGRAPTCWGCGKPNTVLSECSEPDCVKKWENRQQKKADGHQSLMLQDLALEGGSATLEQNFSFVQEEEGDSYKIPRQFILLDSGSTHDTFYSAHLLKDIRPADFPVSINTNGGKIYFDQEGVLPGYGVVYYNPEGIANVLSMARVKEKGTRITYDTSKGSCFHLHNPDNKSTRDFHKIGHGLYLCDTTHGAFSKHDFPGHSSFMSSALESVSMVASVEDNKRLFTPAEIKRAKEARELFKMVGRPSNRDFLGLVAHKMIPNIKINVKDVQNAESIFGPDLGVIQGKTARRTPDRVREDQIDVPPNILLKFQNITLYADLMHAGGIPFLITLSQHIKFYTAARLASRETKHITEALIKVIRLYTRRGFHINIIHVDGEFEHLRELLAKNHDYITLNPTGPNDHNPNIERAIRTVKERFRGLIITLPFNPIPLIMIVHGVIFSVQWLNFFPPKQGVSPRLSPETIIKGRTVDARLHCRIPFGGYAQVHQGNEPINDVMVSRTVGGISLGPTGNMQGTYKFLSTLTGKLFKGTQFTPMPIPREVIVAVKNLPISSVETVTTGDRRNQPDPDEMEYDSDEDSDYDYHSAQEEEQEDDELLFDDDVGPEELPGAPDPQADDLTQASQQQTATEMVAEGEEVTNEGATAPDVELDGAHPTEAESVNSGTEPVNSEPPSNDDADVDKIFEEAENFFEEQANLVEEGAPVPETVEDDESLDHDDSSHDEELPSTTTTRSGRRTKPRNFLMDEQAAHAGRPRQFVMIDGHATPPDEHTPSVNNTFGLKNQQKPRLRSVSNVQVLHYLMTQLSLKQGIKQWKQAGVDAVQKEMQQMHDLNVFEPVDRSSLSREQLRQILRTIIFLKMKRCGRIKARACADGRKQRFLYAKEDAASPTVKTESVLLTALIDALEERDVAIVDIPGAFLRAKLDEEVHICLRGLLADIMVQISKETYGPFVFQQKGESVLYVKLTRALYGCLKSSLQFWKQLTGVLSAEGFETNKYDACVMNKSINGSQCTITFHVDDLKISHKDPQVVSDIISMLSGIYGELSVSRGKNQTYLGMDFDYTTSGEVKIGMKGYLTEILEDFPEDLNMIPVTPAAMHLFDIDPNAKLLPLPQKEIFHQTVARLLWVAIRARPDILTALSFLTTRVQAPDEDDWKKLIRLLCYVQETIDLVLRLSADGSGIMKWLIDAAFANRDKFLSQTGGMLTMGGGAILSTSKKQKLNTKSSTEAELVAVDDMMSQVLWTRYFLLEQGFELKKNVVFQDNQSAILLETNGVASSSKRTRHINIRFFFIKDRVDAGEVEIQHIPTSDMTADFFTKPLQGHHFLKFRRVIMNEA